MCHLVARIDIAYLCTKLDDFRINRSSDVIKKVKVKASHTRYRALSPELIPVYRQSATAPPVMRLHGAQK